MPAQTITTTGEPSRASISRTVSKYVLDPTAGDHTRELIPVLHKPLIVDNDTRDRTLISVWFEVELGSYHQWVDLYLVATGDAIPELSSYIGSAQRNGIIFHVYYRISPNQD